MLDQKFGVASETSDARPVEVRRVYSAADVAHFLRLRRWAILIPILLTCALAYAYVRTAVPSYLARAQIIIDPRLPQFIPGHNEETVLAWDSAQVESEIAVLQSERIASAVVTKLGLDRDKDFRASPSILARAKAFLGLVDAADGKPDRFRDAVNLIEDGLSVKRAGLSYAIDISFSFPDAFRTSEVANATAEAYITDQIENRSQAARVGGEWLQDRMGSLRAQMNAASEAVQVFRASHNYTIAKPGPGDVLGVTGSGAAAARGEDKTLDELEASASTYRRIYESFLLSYTESVQRQSFPVSDARILTPATIPKVKSTPRTVLIYALAGLVGGLIGFGIAILRHRTDRAVRSPGQITDACTLADLGRLPRMRGGVANGILRTARLGRRSAPGSQATRDPSTSGVARVVVGRGPYLFSKVAQRDAAFRQALKGTKTLIDIAGRHEAIKCVGVTSTHARAGSSTLAGNLASLSAAGGARVLLVDADLERRTLTRQVGRVTGFGLVDVLAQAASFDQAVVGLDGTTLDFLPSVTADGSRSRDLSAKRLDLLLKDLTARYDLIVFDLPPLLPIGETLDLSGCLDGVLLAVEWGRTRADQVVEGATYLARAYARPLGFVINKAQA